MAPVLTRQVGDAKATFTEHPTAPARGACFAAAQAEPQEWAAVLRRLASSLPERPPIIQEDGA
jgi:hypothetical protein